MTVTLINPSSKLDLIAARKAHPGQAIVLQSAGHQRQQISGKARNYFRLVDDLSHSLAVAVIGGEPGSHKERIEFAETKGDIQALLLPGLKTVFSEVYGEYPAFWTAVTTVIPSDKDTEQYGWLGAVPGMNEFLDERRIQDLATYTYAIKNKTWESTISVDRTAIEDDLTGQLSLRVRQMAEAAKTHLDLIIFALLASGFTTAGYDGVNFFGTHTSGAPGATFTQSNKLTAEVLAVQGITDAITAMQRFKDDAGRPMGIQPDTLVVPPELQWEAWTLMNSAFYPDAVTSANQNLGANPLRGTLNVSSVPYLTDTNDWFVLDTKRVIKAIILQMRKDFEFDALEMNSETGFLRDKFYYGVRARYNVGFGEWRCALGSSN